MDMTRECHSHRLPLFCYGTLRHREIVRRVVGRPLRGRPAQLHDHALRRVLREPYPAVVPRAGAATPGWLYSNPLTAREWRALDAYEGECYERVQLPVYCQGRRILAWVYRLAPDWRHWASRQRWDYGRFLRTDLKHYLRSL